MQSARWAILALLLLVAISINATTQSVAQTTPRIEQLQVDLWPEYDRSDMLVIYQGTLPDDALLPATLTLRVPARVGEPHAVAYDDGAGNLLQADYSTAITGDWLAITLETPARNFRLEFYDRLDRADDRRSYAFVWPGDYVVEELRLLLLPPPGASEIQTEPPLSLFQGDADVSLYGSSLGRFAAGQEARMTMSYRGGAIVLREGPLPSPGEDGDNTPVILGGIVVTLLLVIAGGIWYTRRPAPQVAGASSSRRPERSKGGRRRAKPSPVSYCTQCGGPLSKDDRYCGQCGTPVDGN